jgi:cytochrome P450
VQPSPDDLRRANEATCALREFLFGLFDERRRRPRADLISCLLDGAEGEPPADEDLFGTLSFLLIAGHETVTNLIATGMLALLRRPQQLERLRREPALVEGAVEELLRFESPVQMRSSSGPTSSTSRATAAATSPSRWERTTAPAPSSRAWRRGSPSRC